MNELVKGCCETWCVGRCRLSDEIEGWGCRLLVCLPDRMPVTERERAELFDMVYTYAEKSGVLECPRFREETIDEVVCDRKKLRRMVLVERRTRAVSLSDRNDKII